MPTKSSKTANARPKRYKGMLTNKAIKALIKRAQKGETIKVWRASALGALPKARWFKPETATHWTKYGQFRFRYHTANMALSSSNQRLFLNFWLAYACHLKVQAEWKKEQAKGK